jgi:hypothetical protein
LDDSFLCYKFTTGITVFFLLQTISFSSGCQRLFVLLWLLQWFEDKQQQIEALDVQFHKLHGSLEALVAHRRGKLPIDA